MHYTEHRGEFINMFWNVISELDLCLGLLFLIFFGLLSLRNGHVCLPHVRFLCVVWLLCVTPLEVLDCALCLLTVVLLRGFGSFESLLFVLLGYVGQLYMMHSCNLVSFYVCMELQTLCIVVLCGLLARGPAAGFGVEAALKFLLLSAVVSGVALFWFSAMYVRTGSLDMLGGEAFWILLVMLFKLGVAPLHVWSVDLYGSVPRALLQYLSTAPKLSLFTFWASAWHHDFSVGLFVLLSVLVGSVGAYGQPALRGLFAYSAVNELGLLLLAVETAGFHSLYQHLGIYIVAQLLLWNATDKRLLVLLAVSLAGLPPLAGFFGKAWIFWHAMNAHVFTLLAAALACTGLSLVYYLRVIRLFWNATAHTAAGLDGAGTGAQAHTTLTSASAVALAFMPMMLVKPFII